MKSPRRSALLLAACFGMLCDATASVHASPVTDLDAWLKTGAPIESLSAQPFAKQPLTSADAKATQDLLWKAHAERLKKEAAADWNAGVIKSGDLSMKFLEKTFGTKPKDGWALFISMHGGGGAPAELNDSQWQNQIKLHKPANSLYIAPRALTNEWNLWHEPNIDTMFDRLIADAVAFKDVDPNHVYLMGYSAGGDGVYQLAPRMADRFAAASMMAGHPNDSQPLGLRNLPFTIHVGGADAAYDRNKIAAEYGKKLDALQKSDPDGYTHETNIHAGMPHWMKLEDAVAVPWMAKFTRDTFPKKIVWKQAGRTHDRFYWLAVPKGKAKGGSLIVAHRDGQTIEIDQATDVTDLTILLNDTIADLDKPVVVKMAGKELFNGKAERTIASQSATLEERGDPTNVFTSSVTVTLPADQVTAKPAAAPVVSEDLTKAVAFLKANMPAFDQGKVTDEFLTSEATLAIAARDASKWKAQIPEEIFLEYVLPYANVDEKREPWRADLAKTSRQLIGDSATIEEAVKKLNAGLFDKVNVHYHATKRPKPNQSPSESMEATFASCSGLSILLIDACRSVNIPARFVGIASWVAPSGPTYQMGGGNHAWVEIWDGRQWRFVGAAEPGELDKTWFVEPASRASETSPLHKVYATAMTPSPEHFVMVWAPDDASIPGIDMTPYYTARQTLTINAPPQLHVEIRDGGRLVAAGAPGEFIVGGGRTYTVQVFDPNGKLLGEQSILAKRRRRNPRDPSSLPPLSPKRHGSRKRRSRIADSCRNLGQGAVIG